MLESLIRRRPSPTSILRVKAKDSDSSDNGDRNETIKGRLRLPPFVRQGRGDNAKHLVYKAKHSSNFSSSFSIPAKVLDRNAE